MTPENNNTVACEKEIKDETSGIAPLLLQLPCHHTCRWTTHYSLHRVQEKVFSSALLRSKKANRGFQEQCRNKPAALLSQQTLQCTMVGMACLI